jgi:hypothetical protein
MKFRPHHRSRALAVLAAALLTASVIVVAEQASAADVLLSQGHPVTASSVENGGSPATNAVDGNGGTRWSSAFSNPQWLQVDLGATATVNRVAINWENAYATAFQIQVSANASTWTTIYSTTTGTGGNQSLTVSGSGRYVRLYATARATQYGVSLWEFQVFGTGGATPSSPPPPTGPIVHVAEFLADCPYNHRLPDDPIVFPNLPGASHSHDFFGNTSTNAASTYETLIQSGSNCNPAIDLSSYWIPTLFVNNVAVPAGAGTTFYYLGEGVNNDVIARIQPFPVGLRIVAGNAKATSGAENPLARWSCLHHGEVNPSNDFVNCPADSMLESYLDFPQCWNGRDLDSADHKSHMAYPVNGTCPATHPVPVPKLRQVIRFPVTGNPATFRLASGPGYTMHGDFFNAWPAAEMAQRVRDCINVIIKCGANGHP